jgi:hypothetical protein
MKEGCGNCKYCFAAEYDRYCLALPKPVCNSSRWKPCIYYEKEADNGSKN